MSDTTLCAASAEEERRLAGSMATAPASFGAMFADRVRRSGPAEAFRSRDSSGAWVSRSWDEVGRQVDEVAAGLVALGVAPAERVAIASGTRLEWIVADLAIASAGAATTTIYPTSTPEDVGYILRDSGSVVVIAEDATQLDKVREHWADLPGLRAVVLVDDDAVVPDDGDDRILGLTALREKGTALLDEQPDLVRERTAAVRPEDLATLIYTSGTTGRPKGVRLRHASWVYEGLAVDATGVLGPDDLHYLWLPLSHSFGKVLLANQLATGFATAVDGDLDALVDNLAVVRPTIMAGAPRIYEKIHGRVVTKAQAEGGVKLKIFTWAFGVGRRVSALRMAGGEPTGLLAAQHAVASKLVFSKLKARFGGRIRFFVSGAAALSQDIGEWFHAADIVILEGYGLTETSAASFVNRPHRYRFGTVGLPFPGTQMRLDTDGEVLVRGPGVMDGYHNLPEETAAVLDADGWLRTGDIGEVTDEGFLRITDRKKDMIKTSGGKYVAPQNIESRFKAVCPMASQVVVHGDNRNFVSALVALDEESLMGWAASHGLAGRPYRDVVTSPEVRELVGGYVDTLNSSLGRWEQIKKFAVLDADMTVEDGDLTPSMKIKRRAVEQKYAHVLDGFYRD